eukprot:scaffold195_cov89-Skeletonema_marinoi.AAC.1
MLYDPIEPCITSAAFQKQDWAYSTITMTEKDMKEVLPPDMPEQRGKGFVICCSTNAYVLVIRSQGNLVLRQGSVDSSTYQAESTQYIRALRYLLRII